MVKSVALSLAACAASALFASGVDAQANATAITKVGQFSYPDAAFLFLNGPDLHITAFKALSTDTVGEVKNVGSLLGSVASIKPTQLTKSITWPNEALTAPKSAVAGFSDVLVVAGGFLVPGKGNGAITLMDRKTGKTQKITSTSDRFYHQIEWLDVDGDGLLDIVTAGANKPLIGSGYGSLYWLKQPASNPLGQAWTQTKLVDGPDVFFQIEDFDGDGKSDLLACQFFTNKLVLYKNLNWLNPTAGFTPTVIDSSIGPVFRSVTGDLNGDGKKEVVVTNHDGSSTGGGVFIYELPSFKKTVAASGIVNILSGLGQAAPGAPIIVKPSTSSAMPSIVVGGDGSGKAWLLTPKDNNFNYQVSVFLDAGKKTIGQVAGGDVDGDGKTEIFVPEYESGLVHVFRFN